MTLLYELSSKTWWVCECGNEPDIDGFFACNATGEMVDPWIEGKWDKRTHLCYRCGSIYDVETFEQIGSATVETMRANYLRGDID